MRARSALVAATGETASFYVRDGDERLCLYRENSRQEIRHHLDEGSRLPLDRGAPAHILRAYTDGTDATARATRKAGFYMSVGERSPDVSAVAVPVFGPDGAFRGALTVSGLSSRFDDARREVIRNALLESARRLSAHGVDESGQAPLPGQELSP